MLKAECLGDTLGKISWINPKRFVSEEGLW